MFSPLGLLNSFQIEVGETPPIESEILNLKDLHSYFNATNGSIFVARRAGM